MATYEKEFLLKVLENLWKVRKFEQRAMEGGLKGEIKGNIHVCLGEERPSSPPTISRPATAATATAS